MVIPPPAFSFPLEQNFKTDISIPGTNLYKIRLLNTNMKNVKEESLSVSAANQALTVNLEARMWKFIVRTINYPELRFDSTTDSICFMSYIPFTTLAKEWIAGNTEGLYDVRKCEDCGEYFDVNKTDGIYGNPGDLEEFICFPCAERMTAREYYERFIER